MPYLPSTRKFWRCVYWKGAPLPNTQQTLQSLTLSRTLSYTAPSLCTAFLFL
eukprot:m.47781 g.47781  ORF g.47781 m.47781 type:complete len:52 (+) comp11000_c0_seq1:118-273(+)